MKRNLTTLFLLLIVLAVQAQTPISVTLVQSFSRGKILAMFNTPGQSGVDIYKVLYTTPMPEGTVDTASGLLVIPDNAAEIAYPFFSYQHATAMSRNAVPSNLQGDGLLAILFASQGYIVTAADYIGLGDSRRLVHPFVHADTEASAGIDLLRAARSFMKESGLHYNDQLFLSGYSQGGHASMAMHKEINDNLSSEFTVTAAAHLSGPYSLSEEMKTFTLGDEVYARPGFLVWLVVGYQSVYGGLYEDISKLIKPEYVAITEKFERGELGFLEMNNQIAAQLTISNNGKVVPSTMVQPEVLNELRTNPDHPINVALRDNDLFDWVPNSPTRLFYCKRDETIVASNSTITAAMMKANGAPKVKAVNVGNYLGHIGCVLPTTLKTLRYFSKFAKRTPVATGEGDNFSLENTLRINANFSSDALVQVYPNPVSEFLKIELKETLGTTQEGVIRLTDLNGRLLQEIQSTDLTSVEMNVQAYPTGMYLLQVQGANGLWTQKIMIER